MARGRTPSKHPPSWSGTFSTSPPCTRYTRVKALDTEACTTDSGRSIRRPTRRDRQARVRAASGIGVSPTRRPARGARLAAVPVRVRQGDRCRDPDPAWRDAVADIREAAGVPDAVGTAVRRHHDGTRAGRGACRIRTLTSPVPSRGVGWLSWDADVTSAAVPGDGRPEQAGASALDLETPHVT